MKTFILILIIGITISGVAFGGPRGRNNTAVYTSNSKPSVQYSNDQERCQAEADHMAANNIKGHVWGTIGGFEGVGYGSSPHCVTCTPSYNMTLTGDASARGRNGVWYRVRSWR